MIFYKKAKIFFTILKSSMISTITNNSNITNFKGYNPNRKFDLIKIDDIPCVYCGKEMFSLSKFDKALNEAKTNGNMFRVGQEYAHYLTPEEFKNLDFSLLYRNPKGIKFALRNLFMPHVSTIEHIIPQSKGGIDNISNYMTACYKCNSNRRSTDLCEILNANPEITQNIQKHIDYLKNVLPKLIRERKISPDYANYLQMLAETLKNTTRGQLDLIS